MTLKSIFITVLASIFLVGCLSTLSDPRPNQDNPGITLEEISINKKNLLLAKIDLNKHQLQIVENAPSPDQKNINQIHQENQSLLSFNGSFFSPEFRPLGLLVSDGKAVAPLTRSGLMNGIMTIDLKGNPRLYGYEEFQTQQSELSPGLSFAIQSGPILIDSQGNVVADRKNKTLAGRTALGLDHDNNLVLIMMRQSLLNRDNALSLYDFANLVSTSRELSGLGIHSLLNLDGGNSSGLAFGKDYYPELEKVQNVIITLKRP
jgi:uncharacterized protein YigE (DUF2233 family)